ncbi:hypothetical protein CC85DRAFT_303954 [Cutaneotrichosporon oleaginosum]|uniref:Uncharacterized protein n=1 Tax=Cutaneotrichosporon oleaginosum TaxID=879819 RepID=A0A0J0XI10_9TREE|nr:uncharacterized protein CC85DRAFT_303954 [Cutaneotrichosporon oleaginosum]KLT40647.1 hypothetical protein CC85DRAFT_303954 [Cutaneotrichosporon oleaginosum]TXT12457.1 hypothetical protein COLE_02867 [Cutaneotrichosporon oleaginosum]
MSRIGTPASLSASASRAPTPASGAATPVTTDLYRPLAAQIQRTVAPLAGPSSASGTPSLASLLGLNTSTYNSRLSGKTLLLTDIPSSGSELVTGRKKNRGDPKALAETKAAQAAVVSERRKKGLRSVRKARAVTGRETRIEYAALLPLHYLHCRYLSQLLPLPPCPSQRPIPSPGSEGVARSLLPGLSSEGLQSKVVKADLTGAKLRVRAARNHSLSGVTGLVIEETAGSFRLLSPDGRVRVVPKDGAQFTLSFPAYAPPEENEEVPDYGAFVAQCPAIEVDILGSSFAFRSGDRAGRKFRPAQGWGGSGWAEEWVQGEWSFLKGLGEAKPYASSKARKRGKSRRKDPLVQGSIQVV